MPDHDPQAERLAEELSAAKAEVDERRRQDIAAIESREHDRAREQGRLAGLQEAFNKETRDHFARINGSWEKTAERLAKLEAAVALLPSTMRDLLDERDTVEGARRFTLRQTIFGAVGMLVLVAAFFLSVYTALHK